jgi:hypothetical protein
MGCRILCHGRRAVRYLTDGSAERFVEHSGELGLRYFWYTVSIGWSGPVDGHYGENWGFLGVGGHYRQIPPPT